MISLAWTLLHFLWQGAALALLFAGVNVMLRNSSARARYLAACTTMLLMFAAAVITFALLEQGMAQAAASGTAQSQSSSVERGASAFPQLLGTASEPPGYLAWLVYAWMIGVAVLSVRSSHAWITAQRLTRKQAWPASALWQERLERLARRLEISRTVRLCESAIAEVPAVIGWLRPIILVPASALAGLAPSQLEALLAHELAHVRRHDYLVNLMQTAIETLLFYHPAVWWVGKRIRAECENCCDDLAVSVCGDVLTYARALTQLEQLRSGTPQLAMAANAGSLLERIRRLVAPRDARLTVAPDWITPVAVILSAVGIWAASGMGSSHYFQAARFASLRLASAVAADTLRVGPIQLSQIAAVQEPVEEPAQTPATPVEPAEPPTPAEPLEPLPDPDPAQAATPPPPAASGSYIGALAEAGYPGLSVDQLIAFKTHGVTPEYVRAMQAAGLKPTPDQLVQMSIHGVTTGFVHQMKSAGFSNVTVDQLVALRIHGAAPDYARQMKELGLGDPSVDQLIAMLIHGVTPDLARQMKAAGLRDLNFDHLIAMQIHGLRPADVREAQKHFKDLSIEQLIKLKQLGILSASDTI
jgi:beta-lactamase regulating signal transducer with metallopeptidase domain